MSDHGTRLHIENEVFSRFSGKYTPEEQANHLVSLLLESYPLTSAAVFARNRADGSFDVVAQRGLSNAFLKSVHAAKSHPIVAAALEKEVEAADDPSFRLERNAKAAFAMPLRFQEEAVGVLVADSDDPAVLSHGVRESMRTYATLLAVILAIRGFSARLSRVCEADDLTGLNEFKAFHEMLQRVLAQEKCGSRDPVSIAFLKIRFLREMNDRVGHAPTDKALKEVARRIAVAARPMDLVARGGATIHVLMPKMAPEMAAAVLRPVVASLDADPVECGGVKLAISAGVAGFPADGDEERDLVRAVEAMVHEAVRQGGNILCVTGE